MPSLFINIFWISRRFANDWIKSSKSTHCTFYCGLPKICSFYLFGIICFKTDISKFLWYLKCFSCFQSAWQWQQHWLLFHMFAQLSKRKVYIIFPMYAIILICLICFKFSVFIIRLIKIASVNECCVLGIEATWSLNQYMEQKLVSGSVGIVRS